MAIDTPPDSRPPFSDRTSIGVITLVIAVVGLVIAGVTVLYGDSLACKGGQSGWPCAPETSTAPGPSDIATPTVVPVDVDPTAPSRSAPPPKVETGPVVLLRDQLTLQPPLCRSDGIDLDTARTVDSASDSEFVFIEDRCVQRSDATLSALQGVPMSVLSSSPGRSPSLDECRAALRSPDNDITGLGSQGGVLCFATTEGHVAGVVLQLGSGLDIDLDITVWGDRG